MSNCTMKILNTFTIVMMVIMILKDDDDDDAFVI